MKCEKCNGTGRLGIPIEEYSKWTPYPVCEKCDGTGEITVKRYNVDIVFPNSWDDREVGYEAELEVYESRFGKYITYVDYASEVSMLQNKILELEKRLRNAYGRIDSSLG